MSETELENRIKEFNHVNGRLRVSITPSCQLACKFCHTEGNPDHGARRFMDVATFRTLMDAYESIGGREVNITGGEPLLHPNILEILDAINNRIFYTSLSTNGLALNRLFSSEAAFDIDLFKISLHTVRTDEGTKALLGRGWNYGLLRKNLETARMKGYNVILNFTLAKENRSDLELVIQEAMRLGCHMKIIDLEPMDHNPSHYADRPREYFNASFVPHESILGIVSSYGILHEEVKDVVGSTLLKFRTSAGTDILVKTPEFGKYHTRMCTGCHKKDYCTEGVFALRVNANGTYRPCILREDIFTQDQTYQEPVTNVLPTLKRAIFQLMEGTKYNG